MIRFESEKYFEDAFFRFLDENRYNPINGLKIVAASRQVDMADHGRADLLILETCDTSGPATEENTYIHIVELKITTLTYQDIGQICRYKDFVIQSGLASALGVSRLNASFSLVGQKGDITQNMGLLAMSAGIGLYHFDLSFDGVKFDEFCDFEADQQKMTSAVNKIKKDFNGE